MEATTYWVECPPRMQETIQVGLQREEERALSEGPQLTCELGLGGFKRLRQQTARATQNSKNNHKGDRARQNVEVCEVCKEE
jgi:hypothetical protein